MTEKELVKQAAEADLLTFIRLVAPHRVLGAVHEELCAWWQRQDAKGNPVPVPAGEYILEDGVTKVYVATDGIISEIEREEQSTEMSSEDLVAVIGQLSERIAALEVEKTELAAAVESAKKDTDAVKAELASVKKAPAVPSVKSQEFKKNAAPVVASNGNSFADFMENIRNKQSK